MTNFTPKTLFIILGIFCLLAVSGNFLPLKSSENGTLKGLPTYKKFQLLDTVGFGVIMSNGISTTTLSASSSPTVKSLVATSTIQLTSVVTGGCAQFDSSGVLSSVGVNCGSGGGRSIDYYAASSSLLSADNFKTSTTTSAQAGGALEVWASCPKASNLNIKLVAVNTQGTTTLDFSNTLTGKVVSHGIFFATTTEKVKLALLLGGGEDENGSTNCGNAGQIFQIMYNRFTN